MTTPNIKHAGASMTRLAAYLGLVQFLVLATWTIYAIFLPELLESVGIERRWSGWVLMADQVLFACFDVAAGFAADRAFRLYARIAPFVMALTAVSCLAFLLLPWLSEWGVSPALFLGITALWVVTSCALRSPLFGLLARHAAKPEVPRLAGLALLGMGLAAALSPYLGTLLKELDPRIPFTLSSLVLLLVAGGLAIAERRSVPAAASESKTAAHGIPIWGFLATLILAASAIQVAVFINAGPRYLREVGPEWLPWLLPVFWVGFSIAAYYAKGFGAHRDPARTFMIGCFMGAAGLELTNLQGIHTAIAGYGIAGLGWGAALTSAFGLAAERGRPHRVATYSGILFAVLASATFLRIGITLNGWPKQEDLAPLLSALPPISWSLGGLLMLLLIRSRSIRRASASTSKG